MTELKEVEYPNCFGSYYRKDEADKVIAELKSDIADLYDDKKTTDAILDERNEKIAELEKQAVLLGKALNTISESHKHVVSLARKCNHANYKRCLDKAEMCEARYDEEDARVNGRGVSWDYISKEMKYWERWRWRWLELAEKFKGAK